jgi:hypothetical protein
MAKEKKADQDIETPGGSVSEQVGPAPLIPRYDKANPTAYYEGRDQALTLLLKGEKIATADWAQMVPNGVATKPGHNESVYELTPKGVKSLSNKHRAEILKINGANHKHNTEAFAKQAPEITAYLIQNKDVLIRILNEGVRAFQMPNAVDKAVAKPMHAALDRVTVGDMDSIAGLQPQIWAQLQKPEYKDNSAAQEIRTAAEGAKKSFDERRDRYDQLVTVKSTMELASSVLEGRKMFRTLSDADKRLLSVSVDGKSQSLVKRGSFKPELTEFGREWALSIAERSTNLKSEATLLVDQNAKNSRDNAAKAKERDSAEKAPATQGISI